MTFYTEADLKTLTPANRVALADRLYEGLSELLIAVNGQALNSELVGEESIVETHFPSAGKLTTRGSGSTKEKDEAVETEALVGEKSYTRPNGSIYHTRKWGTSENADVEVLRSARTNKQFILLYGSPGCGKTALVEASFGEELHTILGSGDTELSDFIGGYVQTPSGGFEWVDGALVKAAENGQPLLIDEIGLIDTKVLSALYGLMDGRQEITITQNPERGTIKAKDGFYVIGATNPNAPGVRLSEALLSRFTIQAEMTTDYSLAKKMGVPALIVTASQNLYKKQQSGEVSWSPQMRELEAFRDVSKLFGTKFAIENLIAVAPEMDRPVVIETLNKVFGEECRPAKI
jgi:nitric oxide reductase NorQ protein